jgi:hypothetical protein
VLRRRSTHPPQAERSMDEKMKRLLVIIIIGIFFVGNHLHADDKIHDDWVQVDRILLKKLLTN